MDGLVVGELGGLVGSLIVERNCVGAEGFRVE